ncbi:KTSC domain-containing protein [Polaromonas sp.]|uniref:KTSC domain-containing protein n=1 Tax=Polaromonas sp. TaxID=1869339 RepID=UPI003457A332
MGGSFSTMVDSSNLHSVVYDSLARCLLVKFNSKACYKYLKVPIGVARSLVAAGCRRQLPQSGGQGHF